MVNREERLKALLQQVTALRATVAAARADQARWKPVIGRVEFAASSLNLAQYLALRHRDLDFAGYLQREQRLFDEMQRVTATWDHGAEAYVHSRFNPAAPLNRLASDATHNRTFRLTPAAPAGQALLLHGLTDSPHSMRALAESLFSRGFEVTVLRLPGHGTLPSMLVKVSMDDLGRTDSFVK